MSIYDIGDAPVATATFRNIAGVLTDPTTVTVKLLSPEGTQTTITPTNPSTGVWSAQVPTFTAPGIWVVKFFGTGAVVAAEETKMQVRTTPIT